MSSTRVRVIAGLVAAMTMIGSAPAQASADNVVVQPIAMTATEQQAVRNYWTPERIAAIPSTPPSGQPPVDGPDGAGWTSGGDVSKTVGRLFFTERGEDASCTATIVDSANGSAAVTAGHCLHTFNLVRQDPRWSANLFFVPGFRDGEQPYGGFVVRQAVADARWVQDDERDEFDQGLVVLNPGVDGRSAIDTVGASQRIGFDVAGGQEVREFGYPRSAKQPGHQGRPEFTGRRLAQCWGPALERTGTTARPVPRGLGASRATWAAGRAAVRGWRASTPTPVRAPWWASTPRDTPWPPTGRSANQAPPGAPGTQVVRS
jgi:hypothetical protein